MPDAAEPRFSDESRRMDATNQITPAGDYRIELDAYAGPLDLLLYLVKQHEIDLLDIPIATLTERYLEHLQVIKSIDVDRAGEFLVMAATLLEIKSRVLMPVAPEESGEEEGDDPTADATESIDPRLELVQQLLAYKRYKDAAISLERRQDEWARRFAVSAKAAANDPDKADDAELLELDLEDVHVMDLCSAFARILDSIGQKREHEVTYDETPISLHAADIHDRLLREGKMTLREIFVGRSGRSEMIGLFLATLELVRNHKIRVLQTKIAGEISLEAVPEDEAAENLEDRDWKNPETGEIEYDYPDPEAKAASEARIKRRNARLAKIRAGEAVDDEENGEESVELDEVDEIDRQLNAIDEELPS